MSSLKAALKAAKQAIQDKNFSLAEYNAEKALEYEPRNYHAHVFMAVIKQNEAQMNKLDQSKLRESESWFKKAIEIEPDNLLAFTGLTGLYELTNHVEGMLNVWEQLAEIHKRQGDLNKYAEMMLKIIAKEKETKNKSRVIELWLCLLKTPELKVDVKEGWKTVVELKELEEKETIQKEVQARRFRLGAPPVSQIQQEVEQQTLKDSPLTPYYENYLKLLEIQSEERSSVGNRYMLHLIKRIPTVQPQLKAVMLGRLLQLYEEFHQLLCADVAEFFFERSNAYSMEEFEFGLVKHDNPERPICKIVALYRGKSSEDTVEELKAILKETESVFGSLLVARLLIDNDADYNGALEFVREAKSILTKRKEQEGLSLEGTEFLADKTLVECMVEDEFERSHTAELIERLLNIKQDAPLIKCKARFCEVQGQYEEAIEWLGKVKQGDLDVQSKIGWLYQLNSKPKEAVHVLQDVLDKRKEKHWLDHFRLAVAYWNLEDAKHAKFHLLNSAKLNSESVNSETFLYLGYYYLKVDQDEVRARKCLEKGYSLNPANIQIALELSSIHEKHGNLKQACEIYENIVSIKSGERSVWMRLGFNKVKLAEYNDAIFSFQTALRLNVKDLVAWEQLGECYFKQGRYVSSMKAYSRAIQLCNNDQDKLISFYNLGRIKHKLGLFKEAIVYYEKVEHLLPDEHKLAVWYHVAVCTYDNAKEQLEIHGNYGRSISLLKKSVSFCVRILAVCEYRCVWKVLGDCLLELSRLRVNDLSELSPFFPAGDSEDLKSTLVKVYQNALIETSSNSHADLANAYFYRKDGESLRKAVETIKQSIQINPQNAQLWSLLGLCLAYEGDTQRSQHALILAIELSNNSNCGVWNNLGVLYLMSNDCDLARDAFKQAQTINPDYFKAWFGSAIAVLEAAHKRELMTHALSLSNFVDPELNRAYALLVTQDFDSSTKDELLNSLHCLLKLKEYRNLSVDEANLLALTLELLGRYHDAVTELTTYGADERVKGNLGRLLLCDCAYEESLLVYNSISSSTDPSVIYVHCLSLFHSNLYEECLRKLESLTHDEEYKYYAMLLISKVHYAFKTEESVEKAHQTLMEIFEQNPLFLPCLLSLLSIGIISGNIPLSAAAMNQILAIPIHARSAIDPESKVDALISDFFKSQQNSHAARAFLARSIMKDPANSLYWRRLADHLRSDFRHLNEQLRIATQSADVLTKGGNRNYYNLAMYYLKQLEFSTALSCIRKAIHIEPWNVSNYVIMYYCHRSESLASGQLHVSNLKKVLNTIETYGDESFLSKFVSYDFKLLKHMFGVELMEEQGILDAIQSIDAQMAQIDSDSLANHYYLMLANLLVLVNSDEEQVMSLMPTEQAKIPFLEYYGRASELITLLNTLIDQANSLEDRSSLLEQQVFQMLKKGNHEVALDSINQILMLDNTNLNGKLFKGIALVLQNNTSKALKAFTSIPEDFPGYKRWCPRK